VIQPALIAGREDVVRAILHDYIRVVGAEIALENGGRFDGGRFCGAGASCKQQGHEQQENDARSNNRPRLHCDSPLVLHVVVERCERQKTID
jgi:hypothetical protein